MRAHWSEPYLWIHLAGLAVLPLALSGCLLALAMGVPILPPWLEWLVVAAVGILPIVWMQWQRPFDIFSILVVALKPEQLTPDQGRILHLLRSQTARFWTLGAAILAAGLLWLIYYLAPTTTAWFSLPPWRPLGLALAAVTFLISNLFLQVPISVLRILLLDREQFQAVNPYPPDKVGRDFTILGWQVQQIPLPLPAAIAAHQTPVTPEATTTDSGSSD